MKAGHLFAGIGGFDIAFEQAGFSTEWQCEIDDYATGVLEKRWRGVPRWKDVCDVHGDELEPVDVITSGSPCQDLSVQGKQKGIHGSRSKLFFEGVRVVQEMREKYGVPSIFLWENVTGALSSNHGLDFAAVLDSLGDIGAVDICWRTLDAQNFGVPQQRRRVFVVADFEAERASQILFEPNSLPTLVGAGAQAQQGASKRPRGFAARAVGEESSLVYTFQDAREIEKRQNGLGIRLSNVMYTLDLASKHAVAFDGVARYLTPTEMERLQGFQDGWTKTGQPEQKRCQQLGNAVAVPVARWIAERIYGELK